MNPSGKAHFVSILQALLVTFLWSTSFIIIKIGLEDIPPLIFAGLRYAAAFLCMLPFVLKPKEINSIKRLTKKEWQKLILLGVIFCGITQGIIFTGLSLLPSVTVSLILNFSPLVVAGMGIFYLAEIPSKIQWVGSLLFIAGVLIYFLPVDISSGYFTGILIMLAGVGTNSISAVLGRNINMKANISPYIITAVSMISGGVVLLTAGITLQGFPAINTEGILYIVWLAVVNTAFAFTLWNKTLRTLTAMESSIINNTMLIQIALLAYFFLGEEITFKEGIGMLAVAAGAALVQFRRTKIKRAVQ